MPSVQAWLRSQRRIVARAVAQSTDAARNCAGSPRPSAQVTTLEPAGAFGAVAVCAPPDFRIDYYRWPQVEFLELLKRRTVMT